MTELLPLFAPYGLAGVALYWAATELTKHMKAQALGQILLAKAQLLTLVALGQLDKPLKRQAAELLKEVEAAEKDVTK